MSDESLCASIYFALGQMDGPFRALPGDMTYSSVFFHVYVPELLRRLGMKDRRENVHPIIGSDAFFDLPPDE